MKIANYAGLAGAAFAFLAALSNGTVGVLSRAAFAEGLSHYDVAFWRCAGALMLLSLLLLFRRGSFRRLTSMAKSSWKMGICAALGIFTLYHFETQAFVYAPIPLVAVLVYAGGLGAIALDVIVLKERITPRKALAMAMVFTGGYVLIMGDGMAGGNAYGVILAMIAGFGYASFMFAWKFFDLRSSLENFWWFLAYGCLFLAVPFLLNAPSVPTVSAMPSIIALSSIPSFCGFFCTILALRYIEAYKTQVIEASEPIFSALFAAIIFHELLSPSGVAAATVIILGALITALPERRLRPAPIKSVS
ncbi:MAG: EamA family transporter [Rhodomicrobium sp.]|nr:EamA family transporter [Rhodomicrobium sp.]